MTLITELKQLVRNIHFCVLLLFLVFTLVRITKGGEGGREETAKIFCDFSFKEYKLRFLSQLNKAERHKEKMY